MKVSVAGKVLADFPELVAQIDREKEADLNPAIITAGSGKKIWWKCPEGPDHKWQTDVCGRAGRGLGCPFCAGREVSVTNRLDLHFPEVAKSWHPTKNGDKTPAEVTKGTAKRYWWKCDEGPDHEWITRVVSRTYGSGCPFCDNKRLSVTNRLDLKSPDIAKEWHPTKNGKLKPSEVMTGDGKRVWWLCGTCDNEWQTKVIERTWREVGCKKCGYRKVAKALSTPEPGQSLGDLHKDLLDELHPIKNTDFDPFSVKQGTKRKVWWRCKICQHEWKTAIAERAISGTGCKKCGFVSSAAKRAQPNQGESLADLHPEIAAEWHPTKNKSVTPSQVRAGSSNRKYWWKCDIADDHEWDAIVAARTGRGDGCPCCAGRKVSVTNSLETQFPDIAKLWHPTRNGDVTPSSIVAHSNTKFWWKCPEGPDHEWDTKPTLIIGNRKTSPEASGCPCCANKKLSVTNSLQTLYPEVAREWHPTKNAKKPDEIVAGTHVKYWWVCDKGPDHEWRATPSKRTFSGRGCPCCASSKLSITNCLATVAPKIAKLWNYEKNGSTTPEKIIAGTHKKFWWKCPSGPDHEWSDTPKNIVGNQLKNPDRKGCPFCSGRRASVTNSLATRYPDIAKMWHPTKNSTTPDRITYGSYAKRWWKCDEGPDHEWRASPSSIVSNQRAGEGSGCPCCWGSQISVTNCLANLYPEIAKEWHPTKNGKWTPDKITTKSGRKVWWQCQNNPEHIWRTSPGGRHQAGGTISGCPECHILPRSKVEVYLSFELYHFIEFDLEKHKIRTMGKLLDVDIVIDSLKMCIEFDGSRYHSDEKDADKDAKKAKLLVENGWRVIRVREEPLKPLTPNDIQVPMQRPGMHKGMASRVLKQIEKMCDVKIPGLNDYLKQKRPINKRMADEYIATLLRDKAQATL